MEENRLFGKYTFPASPSLPASLSGKVSVFYFRTFEMVDIYFERLQRRKCPFVSEDLQYWKVCQFSLYGWVTLRRTKGSCHSEKEDFDMMLPVIRMME